LAQADVELESQTVPLPDRDDTGGTADATLDVWPEILEVVDYKHGSGVFVPVESNYQLRSYLLGKAIETGFSHETYRYTIVQPRHLDSTNGGVMSEDISLEELKKWAQGLAEAAIRVDGARELVAKGAGLQELFDAGFLSVGDEGGSHCTFCEFKQTCPAAIAKVQELAGADFDDDPGDLEPVGENYLHEVVPWIPFIDKWTKALMKDAESVLLRGGEVKGQKLVRKRSNRKWAETLNVAKTKANGEDDGIEVVEATPKIIASMVNKLYKVPMDKMFSEPKLVTGPQMEKLVPKDKRGEFNDAFLFKPPAGLTMTHEGDKREAVTVNPGDDFDDDLEG